MTNIALRLDQLRKEYLTATPERRKEIKITADTLKNPAYQRMYLGKVIFEDGKYVNGYTPKEADQLKLVKDIFGS